MTIDEYIVAQPEKLQPLLISVPIARKKELNDQYIAKVIESAKKRNSEVQFSLHEVNNRTEQNINYKIESIELSGTEQTEI